MKKLSYEELEKKVEELEGLVCFRKPDFETLRRLVVVLRDSNDAVTVQDLRGNITAWNRGAEKMYGYTEAEALQMNIREIVPEEKREEVIAFAEEIRRGNIVESFETKRITKDCRRLDVWLTVTAIVDDKNRPVGVATTERDITERKRIENDLRKVNEELKNFIDVVSHDLKNPIFGIQGLSDLLLKKYGGQLDRSCREHLESIRVLGNRMESLVSDLLDLARVGQVAFNVKNVPSSAIVKAVILNLKNRIDEKGVKLSVAENLPEIHCDRDRIYQVFENLLTNAIKFSADNAPQKIEIGYKDMGAFCQFHVKDNGIGIDPKNHQKIFEKFMRVDETEVVEGSGLGLVIVKKIVNGHGGRVWVVSKKGEGATFFFTVPRHPTCTPSDT